MTEEAREYTWDDLCKERAAMWEPHIKAGERTIKQREKMRHTFPLVRVTHPLCGELLVHAGSNCDAIQEAAKAWKVDVMNIITTAEVWRYYENK